MRVFGCSLYGLSGIRDVANMTGFMQMLLPHGIACYEIAFCSASREALRQAGAWLASHSVTVHSVHADKRLLAWPPQNRMRYLVSIKAFADALCCSRLVVHPEEALPKPSFIPTLKTILEPMNVVFENVIPDIRGYLHSLTGQMPCTIALDIAHAQHFGYTPVDLLGLPVSHFHIRGYHRAERYCRLRPGDAYAMELIRQYPNGVFLLEYPYRAVSDLIADFEVMRGLCTT